MFDAGKRRHGKYAPDGRAEIIGLFLEPSKFFQIYSLEILGGFGEYQRVTAEKAGKIAFFAGGAGFSGGRCWKQSLTGPDFGQEFVPTRAAQGWMALKSAEWPTLKECEQKFPRCLAEPPRY